MLSRRTAGRLLVAIGVLGLVASLGGIVLGRALVTQIDLALERSLTLTAETLEALDASIAVAEETVVLVEDGLAQAEITTRSLVITVEEGAVLLEGTAELTEDRIAGSLESVEESMPPLIQVAAVIDRTLSALALVPFGPAYDPAEPFDDSLREIQRSLSGMPEDLREQAALIRDAGENLAEVGDGTAAIAEDLAAIRVGMTGAVHVLGTYSETAAEAEALIADTREGLGSQVRWARLLITLLGLSVAAGQAVPLGLGWTLLAPRGASPLLREEPGPVTGATRVPPD